MGMAEQAHVTLNISDDDIYRSSDNDTHWSLDDIIYKSGSRRRRLNSFIINALTLGVIIVVGIIGNCLTFVVFWKGNFKSSTSFLFLSLSLIDSAFLIATFPEYSVSALVEYSGWQEGFYSIKPFLKVYGLFIRTTTKTATSASRRQPLHHRVSTAKDVSVVYHLEGKDTVGCRASPSGWVQHPDSCPMPTQLLFAE